MKDNTTKLLGLEDVIVKNVYEDADGCHVELELPRQEHTCPCCGARTDRVHDYRMQKIKDLPISGKNTYLHLRKRRYVCESCGKRFYEDSSFLSRYYRVTSRMVASIINRFRSTVSATDIARESNISVSTALRCFDLVDYRCNHLPEVLSIDEFKGNAGGEKFQTILADADNKCIIDILPNRKSADLVRYFLKYPRKERLKVKYVVMDMSSLFRGVVQTCFPKAIIVADRYHVVRQAVWAMENVRKNVQKKLSPEWRKFFKRSQCLLNKSHVRIAYKTSSTSILFLQHIIDSLANGGRCAMVIDEGVLFRTNEEAYVKTKRKLLDDCNLHTIISLPAGLFSSAGAGVKTNILLAISDLLWYVSCQRRGYNGKHYRRAILRQYHPVGAQLPQDRRIRAYPAARHQK